MDLVAAPPVTAQVIGATLFKDGLMDAVHPFGMTASATFLRDAPCLEVSAAGSTSNFVFKLPHQNVCLGEKHVRELIHVTFSLMVAALNGRP
ncbi:hypothetical protein [Novacetimonas pomaceti]|uniref:hypothetical protein n=1 Tax=Novacetimonas pomaceti TaxID=2021998 RepID=UPI0014034D52|nr:hypothetical protein [Novacetimonas pomaceti]